MEDLNSNEEPPQLLPSKCKPTIDNLESDSTKKLRSDIEEDKIVSENAEKNEIEEDDEEEEEDYMAEEGEETDSEDEEELEHVNGGTERKGKGIMMDDYKGKGKMIEESEEEEEDDDDDDDDDDESEFDGEDDDDDDLSDDPLTEVDLDNILPSFTRRRTAPSSGVHISSHKDNDV